MIGKIRNSRSFKGICVTLSVSIFAQLVFPTTSWALTGGPAQPEFSSFTPVGTSDMVDLSSGDMTYNIPLMDVGGYPLNIAYNGNPGMDDEASWVGLGWNLSVGQINRNVRGLPDDFKGDQMTYENYLKPNITAGADFQFTPAIVGANINLSVGGAAIFNNYTGFTMKPSAGIGLDLGNNASVGFNVESGPDGLNISPNLSIHATAKKNGTRSNQLGINFGTSWNSRRGLSHLTMGVSRKKIFKMAPKVEKVESNQSLGSHIGFAEQLYTPSKRVGMQTGSFTVNAALGSEIFGGEGQGQVTGYGTIMAVKPSEMRKTTRAFGYNNTELAGEYDVLDFNREKDGNFSVNSTNLPVTNYTYDIYAVQGQGVSGTIRPFRNQVGYVYDTRVDDGSESGTFGFEAGTGNSAHLGIDIEVTDVNSHSSVWENDNYIIDFFKEGISTNPKYEKVHYKNVGDLSADLEFNLFDNVGNYQPIRVSHAGNKFNRYATANFDKKNDAGGTFVNVNGQTVKRTQRQMRNQAIQLLTKKQVEEGASFGPLVGNPSGFRAEAQDHHTAEVQIVRNDGARYIYGRPAYNLTKQEVTFAVNGENANCATGLVGYNKENLIGPSSWPNLPNDQYFNRITTPAYVHTHLLTSVLSTDYADRGDANGAPNGPTPDDFGSYTKFTYLDYDDLNAMHNISTADLYRWRVPYQQNQASHNQGLNTEPDDDQGNFEYGEKEIYLVRTIETKTHVAVFSYSPRKDAHGVKDQNGGLDANQKSYKLDKIDLYSVGEYDAANPANSTPIKTVHFEYSYSLCPGVPNNILSDPTANAQDLALTGNELSNHGGKLTLKKIYFTYRNSKMGKYTGYKFNYGEYLVNGQHPDEYTNSSLTANDLNTTYTGSSISGLNPAYNIKAYDSWGNYLPNDVGCNNTDDPTAPEFNFTEQNREIQDVRSAAWCMKEISLPSGGKISVNYESDDYAYVQDREVMRMFKVIGAGFSNTASASDIDPTVLSGELFSGQFANNHRTFLYVQVDGNTSYTAEDYLNAIGTDPIYFRFLVNMTQLGGTPGNENQGKFDYVTGYLQLSGDTPLIHHNQDLDGDGNADESYLALPIELADKENLAGGGPGVVNPIAKASWQFGRKYLSKHVYSMMPNGVPENDIEANVTQLVSPQVINNLLQVIQGPNGYLENKNIGRRFIKTKSWVRLMDASGEKLGGGCRVSQIRMSDIWEEMNTGAAGYQTMRYGQKYTYTNPDGTTSGVATYEPIGNKENPFVQPVFSTVRNLLAPDEENYMEMPFGESFFPSPQVTYGRVTVANVQAGEAPAGQTVELKRLHKTGHVVTEFYTSKDFPTIVDQTALDAVEDRQDLLDNILKLNVRKHFIASQGYMIHLNDMNGKKKSERVYAEGQSAAISGVDYNYSTHGAPNGFNAAGDPDQNKGRLNNSVRVVRPDGSIGTETIGVEVDVVHDFRENQSVTNIYGVNTNLANFFIGTFPGIVPLPLPDYSRSEDRFRSVSTTKIIHTFGLLEETVAYDAGAAVYTKNLAWDQATGEVLVTETIDEFNDKYYTMNYPAHWVYEGMGQAARNIGLEGEIENVGGSVVYQPPAGSSVSASELFTPGDEIFITEGSTAGATYWVSVVNGSLLVLIDKDGVVHSPPAGQTESFKLIRSGHRNLQSAGIMNVTLMENPLDNGSLIGSTYLNSANWQDWRIINAGAVDYSDEWLAGCECGVDTGEDATINPFRVNSRGVWRTKSSRTYLTGRNFESDVTPRKQGFFTSFSPMYKKLTGLGDWQQDLTNWTFVAEVSQFSPYGFELENMDALKRHSAAQYGYNNVFPVAVGANTMNSEIGFDGFEDHGPGFDSSCPYSSHFKFSDGEVNGTESHSGKFSMKVAPNTRATMRKKLSCTSDGEAPIDK